MGGYEPVDKSVERAKIKGYLKKREFADFGVSERKTPQSKRGLKFDENGKWVKSSG